MLGERGLSGHVDVNGGSYLFVTKAVIKRGVNLVGTDMMVNKDGQNE